MGCSETDSSPKALLILRVDSVGTKTEFKCMEHNGTKNAFIRLHLCILQKGSTYRSNQKSIIAIDGEARAIKSYIDVQLNTKQRCEIQTKVAKKNK